MNNRKSTKLPSQFLWVLWTLMAVGQVHAQSPVIVTTNQTLTSYDGSTNEYLIKDNGVLTLDDGFTFTAATHGTFDARSQRIDSEPKPNSVASRDTDIHLTFSDIMDFSTVSSGISISGTHTGVVSGTWSQSGRTLSFSPDKPFWPETVTISVNSSLLGTQGFWVPTNLSFTFEVESLSFITKWKPTDFQNQITLPLNINGQYDFTVDWGDGQTDHIIRWNQTAKTHQYSNSQEYIVTITGLLNGWESLQADKEELLEIMSWGDVSFRNSGEQFSGCSNLIITATDLPNISNLTSMYKMFEGCASLTSIPNFGLWDISKITNLSSTFEDCEQFNENIDTWMVSEVTTLERTFYHCRLFNSPLSSWSVSKVTSMKETFDGAYAFNQSLDSWDVANVEDMNGMFANALSFNQALPNWEVSKVEDMAGMFYSAEEFNQDLSSWDFSSVDHMTRMFRYASDFNQSLGGWNIENVMNMHDMLSNTGLTTQNYDLTLAGWSSKSVQSNVNFGAQSVQFCNATSSRDDLINNHSWTISDGGQAVGCGGARVSSELKKDSILFTPNLSLYPNPADQFMTLELADYEGAGFEIFDASGALLSHRKQIYTRHTKIDLSKINQKMIIIRVTTPEEVQSFRVVLER